MADFPKFLDLFPVKHVHGTVRLPGSKSISNRTLLLSALADGNTLIKDLLFSDDTEVMLKALRSLGIHWTETGVANEYEVTGSKACLPSKEADLFLGNAGTAIRPLTAALAALGGGDFLLHGVKRMHERPIGDLVDALNEAGAQIEYMENRGYPPIRIHAGSIDKHDLHVRGNVSSQFLTALLMAAPLMARSHDVTIHVVGELISKPYIEITLNLMRRFGVKIEQDGWKSFTLRKGQAYRSPGTIHIEGDASSASYFLAAGAISGGPVRVEGVGKSSIQGDIRFADVLEKMGANVIYGENYIEASSSGTLKAIDEDFNLIPDAAMTVAILALYANGTSVLRNIGSWRVKETDRITAMETELKKLGAIVESGEDWLKITPPERIQDAVIDTYDDHRMAMCFSLASLSSPEKTGAKIRINDPQCVSKTFPEYFQVFKAISE